MAEPSTPAEWIETVEKFSQLQEGDAVALQTVIGMLLNSSRQLWRRLDRLEARMGG